jgi:hypothetical protein
VNHLLAAYRVCANAKDADDARELLTMLGLYDGENIIEPEGVPVGLEIKNPKNIGLGVRK